MKFCKDCKHSFDLESTFPKCKAPENFQVKTEYLVSGDRTNCFRWMYCETQRKSGWLEARIDNSCGREGRWFEPRNQK